MVSGFGGAGETAAFATDDDGGGGASAGFSLFVAATTTGAAIGSEPVADFARATGVLSSPFVEAITGPGAVATFTALAAGAAASGFFGAGLNESRLFSAATTSCDRMCGICSKTVSAGRRSFIRRGTRC